MSISNNARQRRFSIQILRHRIVSAIFLCQLLLIPFSVFAQTGGQTLWSVNLAYTPVTAAPKVGPDGTVYIHSDDLYAITSDGHILWTKPSSDPKAVDVSLDGTVYSGSGSTVFAYSPAGTLLGVLLSPPEDKESWRDQQWARTEISM